MLKLYIGDKNYSSWSLRPWLLMTTLAIDFDEVPVRVAGTGPNDGHRPYSDNGLVPCLHDGELRVWDSLAICEYLYETQAAVWPADRQARARARSVSAEMHAGFGDIRSAMPMNIKLRLAGRALTAPEQADLDRISTIWENCRSEFDSDGPFLFGQFCAADAMFAPVVWRFETYNVSLPGLAGEYQQTMLGLDAMQTWEQAALAEGISLPYDNLAETFGGNR
ncbi:MAG: glutathione S-transferase family protein [Burkholderiaceae bacterium]